MFNQFSSWFAINWSGDFQRPIGPRSSQNLEAVTENKLSWRSGHLEIPGFYRQLFEVFLEGQEIPEFWKYVRIVLAKCGKKDLFWPKTAFFHASKIGNITSKQGVSAFATWQCDPQLLKPSNVPLVVVREELYSQDGSSSSINWIVYSVLQNNHQPAITNQLKFDG